MNNPTFDLDVDVVAVTAPTLEMVRAADGVGLQGKSVTITRTISSATVTAGCCC